MQIARHCNGVDRLRVPAELADPEAGAVVSGFVRDVLRLGRSFDELDPPGQVTVGHPVLVGRVVPDVPRRIRVRRPDVGVDVRLARRLRMGSSAHAEELAHEEHRAGRGWLARLAKVRERRSLARDDELSVVVYHLRRGVQKVSVHPRRDELAVLVLRAEERLVVRLVPDAPVLDVGELREGGGGEILQHLGVGVVRPAAVGAGAAPLRPVGSGADGQQDGEAAALRLEDVGLEALLCPVVAVRVRRVRRRVVSGDRTPVHVEARDLAPGHLDAVHRSRRAQLLIGIRERGVAGVEEAGVQPSRRRARGHEGESARPEDDGDTHESGQATAAQRDSSRLPCPEGSLPSLTR